MRDNRERLSDIQEAIERIEKYAAQGKQIFESDELLQIWIIHHLQIIGEACRSLSTDFRRQHPEVSWKQIMGMQHILVYHYFRIDVDIVWSVVERDLPDLKRKIESILQGLGGTP